MSSIANRDESYWSLIQRNALGDKQEAVLRVLHTNGNMTDKDIVLFTGFSLNCVTGRRNELVDMGIVAEVGSVYNEDTNRMVTLWGIVYDGKQSTQKTFSLLTNNELVRLEKLIIKLNSTGNQHQKNLVKKWLGVDNE